MRVPITFIVSDKPVRPITKEHPTLAQTRFGCCLCHRCVWGEDVGIQHLSKGRWQYLCMPSCDAVWPAPGVGAGEYPERLLVEPFVRESVAQQVYIDEAGKPSSMTPSPARGEMKRSVM